jgi:hypothetical protein
MRLTTGGLVVLLSAIVAASTATSARGHGAGACGSQLRDLKTLTDSGRNRIFFRPQPTTIAAINRRPMPSPTPTARTPGFARHVWRVAAQITQYRLDADGAIHLILFDANNYMIAEMPSPLCLSATTRDRHAIADVRRTFESRCGAATPNWRSLGAVVSLSGVGFWDSARGQKGHARNYAELSPVTAIRFVAGCA